ncbi:MAG: hypothetical protein MK081_06035 [Flavobacteriales bacterium]|nr:hypothetical protein [Flavobacteriales bacterium]
MATSISGKRKLTKKLWFPAVDRLRLLFFIQLAFAAWYGLFVVDITAPQITVWNDYAFHAYLPFFVLTGFLSTYSLSAEKRQFGSFHIIYYFWRRAIGLLPYYLVLVAVAVGYALMSDEVASLSIWAWLPVTSAWHACVEWLPTSPVMWAFVPLGILFLFHLIWPICMWLIPSRGHLWLEIFLITLSLLFRAGFFTEDLPEPWHPLSAAFPLMLGALLGQQLLLHPTSFMRFRNYRKPIRLIVIPGSLICLFYLLIIPDFTHIHVMLELVFCSAALLLIAKEASSFEETEGERSFWKSGRWILPATVGFAIAVELTYGSMLYYYVLLIGLAGAILCVFTVKSLSYSHFNAWKEKYTFRIRK